MNLNPCLNVESEHCRLWPDRKFKWLIQWQLNQLKFYEEMSLLCFACYLLCLCLARFPKFSVVHSKFDLFVCCRFVKTLGFVANVQPPAGTRTFATCHSLCCSSSIMIHDQSDHTSSFYFGMFNCVRFDKLCIHFINMTSILRLDWIKYCCWRKT